MTHTAELTIQRKNAHHIELIVAQFVSYDLIADVFSLTFARAKTRRTQQQDPLPVTTHLPSGAHQAKAIIRMLEGGCIPIPVSGGDGR